jgi:hypothetical protein
MASYTLGMHILTAFVLVEWTSEFYLGLGFIPILETKTDCFELASVKNWCSVIKLLYLCILINLSVLFNKSYFSVEWNVSLWIR